MTRAEEANARIDAEIDAMAPDLRKCVHEYGYAIVHACLESGVRKPARIHNLVREIWSGARVGNERTRKTGAGNGIVGFLDWILIQSGSSTSAACLARQLWERGYVIIPRQPTERMIEASKAEVSDHATLVTKTEKHRRRLSAAIAVAIDLGWPDLHRDSKRSGAVRQSSAPGANDAMRAALIRAGLCG